MKTATVSGDAPRVSTKTSFSSLYFGMKTATLNQGGMTPQFNGPFSSLYFGMKTATPGLQARKIAGFWRQGKGIFPKRSVLL